MTEAALMAAALNESLSGASAAVRPCEMYRDHGSATPSVTQGHHVYPVYLQNRKFGEIRIATMVWLCGTCHDNVHAWLYWLMGERSKPNPQPPARAKAQAQIALDWFTGP